MAPHFPISFADNKMTIIENWRTLGRRGTGSHDVLIDAVIGSERAVALRCPKGKWHPFFNVAAAVALPLIGAARSSVASGSTACCAMFKVDSTTRCTKNGNTCLPDVWPWASIPCEASGQGGFQVLRAYHLEVSTTVRLTGYLWPVFPLAGEGHGHPGKRDAIETRSHKRSQ